MRIIRPERQIITRGLVGWWPFREGSGTSVKDYGPNGLDGSIEGGSWTTGISPPSDEAALDLTSEGDGVVVAYDAALRILGDYTIHVWVNLDSYVSFSNQGGRFIGFAGSGETEATNWLYVIYLANDYDGSIGVGHEYGSGANQFFSTSSSYLSLSTDYLISVSKNSSTKKFRVYVDGDFKEELSYTNEATGGTSAELTIGMEPAFRYRTTNGRVGPARIYNVVQTDNEIAAIAAGEG